MFIEFLKDYGIEIPLSPITAARLMKKWLLVRFLSHTSSFSGSRGQITWSGWHPRRPLCFVPTRRLENNGVLKLFSGRWLNIGPLLENIRNLPFVRVFSLKTNYLIYQLGWLENSMHNPNDSVGSQFSSFFKSPETFEYMVVHQLNTCTIIRKNEKPKIRVCSNVRMFEWDSENWYVPN